MPSGCHKAYPVAMIPYINMQPYRARGPPPRCCWHDYVPRDSVEALATGKVLVAAVPVGALPGLGASVEPLGQYGIAARESSMSVLFFSERPFDRVSVRDRMQLTSDSATSVRLLHLLLGRRQPSPGERRLRGAGNDVGELIIGDRALKTMHVWRKNGGGDGMPREGHDHYSHVTDLATCWHQLYRRPFVFARWMIRRDAPPEARAILLEWLDKFKAREEALVLRAIPVAARQTGLPATCIANYFQCLRRVLDEDDLAGQTLFLQEIRRTQIDRVGHPNAFSPGSTSGSRIAFRGNPIIAGKGFAHDMDAGTL